MKELGRLCLSIEVSGELVTAHKIYRSKFCKVLSLIVELASKARNIREVHIRLTG